MITTHMEMANLRSYIPYIIRQDTIENIKVSPQLFDYLMSEAGNYKSEGYPAYTDDKPTWCYDGVYYPIVVEPLLYSLIGGHWKLMIKDKTEPVEAKKSEGVENAIVKMRHFLYNAPNPQNIEKVRVSPALYALISTEIRKEEFMFGTDMGYSCLPSKLIWIFDGANEVDFVQDHTLFRDFGIHWEIDLKDKEPKTIDPKVCPSCKGNRTYMLTMPYFTDSATVSFMMECVCGCKYRVRNTIIPKNIEVLDSGGYFEGRGK